MLQEAQWGNRAREHKEMENERLPRGEMPYKLLCNALDLKTARFQLTVQLPEKCYSTGINGYTLHILKVYISLSNKNESIIPSEKGTVIQHEISVFN